MNQHTLLFRHGQSGRVYANKSLEERLTGKFYTPIALSNSLAKSIIPLLPTGNGLSLIDPFCGDGRLIVSFLGTARQHLVNRPISVTLWDCDNSAVSTARNRVADCGRDLGLKISIDTKVGDSFKIAAHHIGKFDVCLTNPPWETLKPDRREIEHIGRSAGNDLIGQLRKADEFLTETYPTSQPLRKFSGWGTNLARVGTEVAARLLRDGGACGVVTPASLFGDQNSERLRRWLFDLLCITNISFFPAEARLFDRVDQSVSVFCGRKGKPTRKFVLQIHGADSQLVELGALSMTKLTLHSNLAIPFQLGLRGMDVTAELGHLPQLKDLEDAPTQRRLWVGREIDETGHQNFMTDSGEVMFVKGRMIGRYEILQSPTQFITSTGPKIPSSVHHQRIAWRDVSRSTQKRRIQAAIIPPKWVAGNSLHVAFFPRGNDRRLRSLLALMNSVIFEVQARGLLTTSHVSLGAIRNIRIPKLDLDDKTLELLCIARINGDLSIETILEIYVAKLYGFTRDRFSLTLELFPKLSSLEKDNLLSRELWD